MSKAGDPRIGTKRRSDYRGYDRTDTAGRVAPHTLPFLDAVGKALADFDDCGCADCRVAVMAALHACDDARGIRAPE